MRQRSFYGTRCLALFCCLESLWHLGVEALSIPERGPGDGPTGAAERPELAERYDADVDVALEKAAAAWYDNEIRERRSYVESMKLAALPEGKRRRTISLIGAGFQRTGTESILAALKLLKYHPSHGEDVSCNMTRVRIWEKAAAGGDPHVAIESILEDGFDVTLDSPYRIIWKDLMHRFPDARVILSVHPHGPSGWTRSIIRGCSLLKLMGRAHSVRWLPQGCMKLKDAILSSNVITEEMQNDCVGEYTKYNNEVIRQVPPEKLLVYNVSTGWKPICEFVGAKVPEVDMQPRPFPHNDCVKRAKKFLRIPDCKLDPPKANQTCRWGSHHKHRPKRAGPPVGGQPSQPGDPQTHSNWVHAEIAENEQERIVKREEDGTDQRVVAPRRSAERKVKQKKHKTT